MVVIRRRPLERAERREAVVFAKVPHASTLFAAAAAETDLLHALQEKKPSQQK
jgi:hypothetical protein